MLKKLSFFLAVFIFFSGILVNAQEYDSEQAIEEIYYDVSAFGNSVYQDLGQVEFRGKTVNLVIFKTRVMGFEDKETIYSDPVTGLPLWIERNISTWFDKEYLTEKYMQDEHKLTIIKFKENKKVEEHEFKASGPIQNAILLPFSLRKVPDLEVGWSCDIMLPAEFKVKLVSIDDVAVPAGKFKAYHFISEPAKFQIWISADSLRLPVKIAGAGGLSYTMVMKKYSPGRKDVRVP